MGFTATQLSALRAMAEGFFDTTALILTPVPATDDLGEVVPGAFTAVVHPARFTYRDRLPAQGHLDEAGREIADWQTSMPHTASLSARSLVLPGAVAWRGAWSAGETYEAGDAVGCGGRFFTARAATAQPLSSSLDWDETPAFEVVGVNLPASNRVRCIADLKRLA